MSNDIQTSMHLDPRHPGIRPGGKDNRMAEALQQRQLQEGQNAQARMSGLAWAAIQAASQAKDAQQTNIQNQGAKFGQQKGQGRTVETGKSSSSPELQGLNMDDAVSLTSTVSVRPTAVKAPSLLQRTGLTTRFPMLNPAALEESYKDAFKNTRSHNLLMERFFSHLKVAGLQTMMSAMGVSPEEFKRMQREVKEESLKEIHSKLENDWAYSKALLDILGG